MPDYVKVYATTPGALADLGGGDLTLDDLESDLEELVRAERIDGALVYRSPWDWLSFGALAARDGKVEHPAVAFVSSEVSPEVLEAAKAAPEVALPLDIEAERFADLLERVAVDAGANLNAEARTIRLPLEYRTPSSACTAFALIAKHLTADEARFLVEIDHAAYLATLTRGRGAQLVPLEIVCREDAQVESLLRATFRAPNEAVDRACPDESPWLAGARDESKPFTTGSIVARKSAVGDLLYPGLRSGSFSSQNIDPTIARAAGPQVLAALRSPENAGDAAVSFRTLVYENARSFVSSDDAAIDVWLDGLAREPEAARCAIYLVISRFEDPRVARALVRGYKEEPIAVRRELAQFLWKNRCAIELLVREELVPSWGSDEKWCKRIVRLIQQEYLPVPRVWLAGASPDLVAALGSRVTDLT